MVANFFENECTAFCLCNTHTEDAAEEAVSGWMNI